MRKVEYWDYITREQVRANRDKVFLFGDNLERRGYAGQAKEMRREPNAIGIVTKKHPYSLNWAYFYSSDWDKDGDYLRKLIDLDFDKVPDNITVVIPTSGLGTGLARLQEYCPEMLKYIESKIEELNTCPTCQHTSHGTLCFNMAPDSSCECKEGQ